MIRLTGIPSIATLTPAGTRWVPISSLQSKYIGPMWYFGSFKFFEARLTLEEENPAPVWLYRYHSKYDWYMCTPGSSNLPPNPGDTPYARSWSVPRFSPAARENTMFLPPKWHTVNEQGSHLSYDAWEDLYHGYVTSLYSGTGVHLHTRILRFSKLEVLLSEEQYQERRASNS